MDIVKATKQYEAWVAAQARLIPADIERKHQAMAGAVFPFFRATFYRWAQMWPTVAGDVANAPLVLGVGDLHVENFGLWRDAEGRLVWGINDFDEAYKIPYTADLVRLVASAMLAAEADGLKLEDSFIASAVLAGYQKAISGGALPVVLADRHQWLRELAVPKLKEPSPFWTKLTGFPKAVGEGLVEATPLLQACLPAGHGDTAYVARVAGLGSLGRERIVALTDFLGGLVAREAKILVPSGWGWAAGETVGGPLLYPKILAQAVRCPDPFVALKGKWLLRRLAPDGSRLELTDMPNQRSNEKLLGAMGFETANIHYGDKTARAAIVADLAARPKRWLSGAARAMRDQMVRDFHDWSTSRG
jgi:hypothetical protein